MASSVITISVTPRWWVNPYIACLSVFSALFFCEPDMEKLVNLIATYGFKVKVS